MLNRAIEIAIEAFKDKKDKFGNPYLMHLMNVMNKGRSENEKIAGILHDLVEDIPGWSFERLSAEGFSDEVIEALRCVTKLSEEEDYDLFIERVKTNALAIKVKIADLEDNLDVRRIPELNDKDLKRLNKYLKAYRDLKKHLEK